jgi:phage-related minor tail protein
MMPGVIDLATYATHLVLDDKNFTVGMQNAEQTAEKFQSKMSSMAGFLKTSVVAGIAAVTAAVGAMAVAGVKSAMELDDTMAKFRSSTGMTAEEAEKVKETIKDLYKTNEDSYQDIAKMAEALHNNMQMSADDIKKYAQNFLDFAKVTGQTDEEVVGALDDIGDAWSLANEEILPIMDKLKFSQEQFGLSVQDSQAALKQMAPAFQGLGMNIDDAISYLNLFASTGVDSSTAITAFSYALKQVKSPTELQKVISDIQNTSDATERAHKAVGLFGARAGIQMANALKPGTQSLAEIQKTMEGATGVVEKASKTYDASLKVQLTLLQKQLMGLFTDLGDKLAPLVAEFVNWLQTNMPAIQATLTTVFDTVGSIISGFIQIISNITNAFKNWYNSNSKSAQEFRTFFEGFKVWFSQIFNSLRQIVETVWQAIKIIWQRYGNDIVAITKPIFEILKTIIRTAMNLIRDIIKTITALIKGDWAGVWNGIKQIFVDVWHGIQNILPNLLEGVYAILRGSFKVFLDIGKNMFNALWDGMKSIWYSIKNWVNNTISWLKDKLTFWNSSKSKMSSSSSGATYVVPAYASGTTYVPFDQLALIHEGEAIIPKEYNPWNPANKNVVSQQKIENNTQNFNFHIDKVETKDADSFLKLAKTLVIQYTS